MNRVEQMEKYKGGTGIIQEKNKDYGDAFAKFGVIGVLMRIEDKLQRSISITKAVLILLKMKQLEIH